MRCVCAEMHMEPSGSWAMPASSPQIAHSTARQLLVESGGHMCWRSTLAQHHTHHHQVLRALQMDATAAGGKAHAEHGPSSHKPLVQSARKTTACGVQQVAPPPALQKRAGSTILRYLELFRSDTILRPLLPLPLLLLPQLVLPLCICVLEPPLGVRVVGTTGHWSVPIRLQRPSPFQLLGLMENQ